MLVCALFKGGTGAQLFSWRDEALVGHRLFCAGAKCIRIHTQLFSIHGARKRFYCRRTSHVTALVLEHLNVVLEPQCALALPAEVFLPVQAPLIQLLGVELLVQQLVLSAFKPALQISSHPLQLLGVP